jgi:hypothetical protein
MRPVRSGAFICSVDVMDLLARWRSLRQNLSAAIDGHRARGGATCTLLLHRTRTVLVDAGIHASNRYDSNVLFPFHFFVPLRSYVHIFEVAVPSLLPLLLQ